MQLPNSSPGAFPRLKVPPPTRIAILLLSCGLTLILAWLMRNQPFVVPVRGPGLYFPAEIMGIGLYSILYATLLLLAYRLQSGVYLGFPHSAIVAAYLTLGAVPAVVATVLGVILAEV